MNRELVIKKCLSCGATIEVIEDCKCNGCGIVCCDKPMQIMTPNSVDAAVEKHVPTYEIKGNEIVVKVNHVMEDEHFIEWIALVCDGGVCKRFLNPGEASEKTFKYKPGTVLYAYCNKHGLWKTEVK